MKLYLVRHGEAYSNEERFERPLNPRGQNEVLQIANYLKSLNVELTQILHSEKLRSIETAEIIAQTLGLTSKLHLLPTLDPDEDVYRLIGDIHEFTENILMVGHLPNLALLSSFILTGNITHPNISFLTATAACFDHNNDIWRLEWTVDPAQLRNKTHK